METFGKQITQASAGTSAASVYSPASHYITEITSIKIVNTSGGNIAVQIYHDEDGTTYSTATEIWEGTVNANTSTEALDTTSIWMNGENSGNIAVAGASTGVTVTLYGKEYKRR